MAWGALWLPHPAAAVWPALEAEDDVPALSPGMFSSAVSKGQCHGRKWGLAGRSPGWCPLLTSVHSSRSCQSPEQALSVSQRHCLGPRNGLGSDHRSHVPGFS